MFQPIGARILVRRDPIEGEKLTSFGIVIPETAQDRPLTATVIAVGSVPESHEDYRSLVDMTPGSRVMLGRYSGADVKVDGEVLTVVPVSDVLGLLR